MTVLIVGGAGYIGGTTAQLFKQAGHDVVVLDNLSTGHTHNVEGLELVKGDAGDTELVASLCRKHHFDVVLDFAAKIRVDESVAEPRLYFENNTVDALRLIDTVVQAGVKQFIFSSTAAVYGQPERLPIDEQASIQPLNPYGMSKHLTEQILASYGVTHDLNWTAFRYFNAAGAYKRIGPDYPFRTHLIPSVIHAQQAGEKLQVFGDDYDTPDGTCVRDYIHVEDVARAHVMAAEQMVPGLVTRRPVNLGTGTGNSVLEVIKTIEAASGQPVEYAVRGRRPGDSGELVASNALAHELFGWEPRHSLEKIVSDAISWQTTHKPSA